MLKKIHFALLIVTLATLLAACQGPEQETGPNKEKQVAREQDSLIFWHVLTQRNGDLLTEIVEEYNAGNPAMPITLRYAGNYTDMFRKVRLAVKAGDVPDMIVAYPAMIAEYHAMNAVAPLDPYINDPEIGLSEESLDDIFETVLENCRYPEFGDQYLTFPFTKSVLMMYANTDLIKQAGYTGIPETWEDFMKQCLTLKEMGKNGYALSVDASTYDAIVYSLGGTLVDAQTRKTHFDQPEAVQAFRIIQDMVEKGGAVQIDREGYGDRQEFAAGNCGFMIRSSTTRPYLENDIQGAFNWDMSIIPHGKGATPQTVQFGADIAIMKTSEKRQRAAWEFVKFFSSRETTARWSVGTGYLPVRKSAVETEIVQEFLKENLRNTRALNTLPQARPEPSLRGWQAVRNLIEQAESQAIGGRKSPEEIGEELKAKADAALEQAVR
ncbi:MAG: ABC transporter substrate-binding protein [Candidatus Sumerlaeota bacterium]